MRKLIKQLLEFVFPCIKNKPKTNSRSNLQDINPQKTPFKLMIEHFLDSTLVIDDTESDVIPLIEQLQKEDIWINHFHPNDLIKRTTPLRSRKLVFLDLYLQEGADLATNISIIREVFEKSIGKNFGCYGVILWSKHTEELDKLQEKMILDKERYCLPLFILPLEKTKYMREGYDTIVADIDKVLQSNVSSNFFVYWNKLVDLGKNHSIQSIYSLASNSYATLESDLQFLLFQLAKNQTGIPVNKNGAYKLEDDAIKAIADMLNYDIIHQHNTSLSLFQAGKTDYKFSGDTAKVFSKLNSKLFIDSKGMDPSVVIPGNVYQVLDTANLYALKGVPVGATHLILEVTPPCDFAVDKKAQLSRVLGGFYIEKLEGAHVKEYGKDLYYKFLNGISLPGIEAGQTIRFDYRYSGSIAEDDLKDTTKYKLLFRFKDKLFADILQKSSAHTSRLGIPFIQ